MATTADSFTASRPSKAPISTHPAFPAIVALWFAALLGLGSLVLPVGLIERLVTVTGIASAIPAAEPPLGFAARAGIALGASIAGALVGLLLARKVTAASAPEPKARSFAVISQRECRPISAHDELGEEGLDSPASVAKPGLQKRRSLAIAEDNRRSDYLQPVPLPGESFDGSLDASALAETPAPGSASDETVPQADPEPLELGAFATPENDADEDLPDPEAAEQLEALRQAIHTPDTLTTQDYPMADDAFRPDAFEQAQEFQPVEQPSVPQAFEPEKATVDPLPFAAPSLRRSVAAIDEDEPADPSEAYANDEAEDEDPFAGEFSPQLTLVEPQGDPGADDRPLAELGLVQLAARLGASIEKRRARLTERQSAAPAPEPAVAPFAEADDFEAAGAEDAARAIADFFGPANRTQAEDEMAEAFEAPVQSSEPVPAPAAPIPAPLRGLSLDHDDDHDEDAFAASFSLPLGSAPRQAVEAPDAGDGEDYDEEDADDDGYSSLLGMKNPFVRQQEFVRVEEPEDGSGSIEPAVTFPSPLASPPSVPRHDANATAARPFDPPKTPVESAPRPAPAVAPRDPGDAERSLRDALATLQRMSGAA